MRTATPRQASPPKQKGQAQVKSPTTAPSFLKARFAHASSARLHSSVKRKIGSRTAQSFALPRPQAPTRESSPFLRPCPYLRVFRLKNQVLNINKTTYLSDGFPPYLPVFYFSTHTCPYPFVKKSKNNPANACKTANIIFTAFVGRFCNHFAPKTPPPTTPNAVGISTLNCP